MFNEITSYIFEVHRYVQHFAQFRLRGLCRQQR